MARRIASFFLRSPWSESPAPRPVISSTCLLYTSRRELEAGRDPWPALVEAMESNPDMVILCDEVGCGIVPIEPFQRQWREETGRICCKLAQQARQVQRVYCGIAATLKEEKR